MLLKEMSTYFIKYNYLNKLLNKKFNLNKHIELNK